MTQTIVESPEDIEVTDGMVRQRRVLSGYQAELNRRHGEGNWGDEEVRRLIQEKEFAKLAKKQETAIDTETFKSCVQKYLDAFENVTPNDLKSIEQLCALEAQIDHITERLAKIGLLPDDLDTLTKVQDKLMLRHGTIQDKLGISRSKRRTSQQKGLDAIMEEIERGREFIEKEAIKVTHCNVLLGWVVYHFRELPYRFWLRCPRCGEEVVIEGGSEEALKELLETKER